MANIHKDLPSLYSDIADAIRIKTNKMSDYLYNEPEAYHDLWFDNEQGNGIKYGENYIHADSKYVITCDGKKYICTAYVGPYGMHILGDENCYWRGEENTDYYPGADNIHTEDVPFCIVWEEDCIEGVGDPISWGEWGVYFPDDNPHSLKVNEWFDKFQYISPKNFPQEIRAIPSAIPVYSSEIINVTFNFSCAGVHNAQYQGLYITGWFVNNDNYLEYKTQLVAEEAVADQTYTYSFKMLSNTLIECYLDVWLPSQGAFLDASGDIKSQIQCGTETVTIQPTINLKNITITLEGNIP